MPPLITSGVLRRRLGLRARLTTAFAVGALAVSALLALTTYGLARTYLLRQRESSLLRQTYANARLVSESLSAPDPDVPLLLSSVATPGGSHPVLVHEGRWFAGTLIVGPGALPGELREEVLSGTPARQLFTLAGVPQLAVGVPVPAARAAYFEVFPLDVLERTLAVLRGSLLLGALGTAAGGALLGRFATRRLLEPVAALADASEAVAGGRLDVRLDGAHDPDLLAVTRSFNHMTDALQERIQRDARFAAAVSHELRSPLTTLAAAVSVLEARRDELPERSRLALDMVASEVQRFGRLVQDLLEISRLDAGGADLVREEVRLADLVRHALQASEDEVTLEIDVQAADVRVEADKRRLEQVVANLLDNARRYAGGAVRVAVEAAPVGAVRLVVEDAGPGVAADERERVFERFARGRAAGRGGAGEGTGLGLSLVAEHVRLHGGRVWVEDRPGGGARFVVELPTRS